MTAHEKGNKPSNFIRAIIDEDLKTDKYEGRVVTRFPPEPNGYLHIGHSKSICLNFGLARDYQGSCHLRFDDTNPTTEDPEYVESIQKDIQWLGFEWGENLYFTSDYFDKLYQYAEQLIEGGHAYVDSLSLDEIREYRGTVTTPGKHSPYRDRSTEENMDLFRRMRAGEFEDGTHVLRAKIDMAHPNMKMRDPLLYRIRHAHHYRTGDKWCIYPMYDYAHCLSDAIENITHSICTLEFENNRDIYDWVLDTLGFKPRPYQHEFARLNVNYTVMSKRKLLELVQDGLVDGWDDPRMPTISGLRRRGVTAESLRKFCDAIGVAKANSVVDFSQLEYHIRDDLNHKAPRVMGVLNPLRVVIENFDGDSAEMLEGSYWPHDVPNEGSRTIPFSREIYIERDDFMENAPKKFFRLVPGGEVRLRHAYVIRCKEVVKDEAGEIDHLICTYDKDTLGKNPGDRKVKGTIHWVSATHGVPAEIRLYDRLFQTSNPNAVEPDFTAALNPDSLRVVHGFVEPALAEDPACSHYQFERQGYFYSDPDSTRAKLLFNRTVTLKDSWSKQSSEAQPTAKPEKKTEAKTVQSAPKAKTETEILAEKDGQTEVAFKRYHRELGLSLEDADLISSDPAMILFFDEALAGFSKADVLAKWFVNELMRELKHTAIQDLKISGKGFAELVALVDQDQITANIGKEVLANMLESGNSAATIVEEKGLKQMDDDAALATVIDGILAANPDEVARFRAGEKKLQGFFMGQIMKATQGKANPKVVGKLLPAKLAGK